MIENVENNCPICHEGMFENLFTTNCDHTFHADCIKMWCKKNSNCPICREFVNVATPRVLCSECRCNDHSKIAYYADSNTGLQTEIIVDRDPYTSREKHYCVDCVHKKEKIIT